MHRQHACTAAMATLHYNLLLVMQSRIAVLGTAARIPFDGAAARPNPACLLGPMALGSPHGLKQPPGGPHALNRAPACCAASPHAASSPHCQCRSSHRAQLCNRSYKTPTPRASALPTVSDQSGLGRGDRSAVLSARTLTALSPSIGGQGQPPRRRAAAPFANGPSPLHDAWHSLVLHAVRLHHQGG